MVKSIRRLISNIFFIGGIICMILVSVKVVFLAISIVLFLLSAIVDGKR